MEDTSKILSIVAVALLILGGVILVFHFWVFPTGIEVLKGFDFVNVTDAFSHALYWFVIGLIVLFGVRSAKVTFN